MSDSPVTGVHDPDRDRELPSRPAPFDQEFVEPPEPPPPAWMDEQGPLAALDDPPASPLDGPAAGVVRDVIADRPISAPPPAAPSTPPTPPPASSSAAPPPPVVPSPAPSGGPDAAIPPEASPPAPAAETPAPPLAKPVPPAPSRPVSSPPVPTLSAKTPSTRKTMRAQTRSRLRRRTIRYVDPWSALKLAFVFYACLFLVFLVAGVVLWLIASAAGVIGNVEHFFGSLVADKHFHFLGTRILEGTVLGGLVLVVIATLLTVLAVVFFNLIADLVGGVDVTVVDHDASPGPPI